MKTILIILLLGFPFTCFAQVVVGAAVVLGPTFNPAKGRSAGGIGGMMGYTQGEGEGGAVFEGKEFYDQKQDVYGHSLGRLEISGGPQGEGLNLGLTFENRVGETLLGNNKGSFLHIGYEIPNLLINVNTNDQRTDYIEWQPMMSVGGQLPIASCRILALIRGGGSLGNLGDGGARWAYGSGAYLNCPKLDLIGEITRIKTKSGDHDLANADLSYSLDSGYTLNLRGEAIEAEPVDGFKLLAANPTLDKDPQDGVEKRVLLTVGTVW